jgi:N-methylhydantoinase B/oxoprolinase/acetone carboxylase alpha subunit
MQEAVKFQIEYAKDKPLKLGDVLLVNHPACGGYFFIFFFYKNMKKTVKIINIILGSHLPDLTVITPVIRLL